MLLKIFCRMFLSQAVWNNEKMQNIGFLWSVLPFLKKIYPDVNDLKNSIKRNLEYFNTHPYFMGIFAGILILWEKKNYELVSRVKTSYGGPMAALGNQMFWTTLRPLIGMAAILIAWTTENYFLPSLTFMSVYNSVHMPLRYYFLEKSSKIGLDFFYILKKLNPNRIVWYLQIVGVMTAVCATICYLNGQLIEDVKSMYIFVLIIAVTALMHIFFKSISALKIFYSVIIFCIVAVFFKII